MIKLSRPSRVVAAAIALFSILFMQLAVASYACPGLGMEPRAQMMMDGATAKAAPCPRMDPAQPSLCHAYGEAGKQSLDKPGIPPLPPFIAVGFGLPVNPLDLAYPSAFNPPDNTAFLARATAPPLAIRNCCFRI